MKLPQWIIGPRWLGPFSFAAVCGISLLMIGLVSPVNGQVAAGKADEVVVLSPIKVVRGDFGLSGRLIAGTDNVRFMKVTWVGANTKKIGLRIKDELISIDRMNIKGMPQKQLTELMEMHLAPGKTKVYYFLGRRGLLGKQVYVEITYTGDEKPSVDSPAP